MHRRVDIVLFLLAACSATPSAPCSDGWARCDGDVVQRCVGAAWVEVATCGGPQRCEFGACVGSTAGGSAAGGSAAGGSAAGGSAAGGSAAGGTAGLCGNGLREFTEACDGNDLAARDCRSLGFVGGTLTCTATCQLNLAACTRGTVQTTGTLATGQLPAGGQALVVSATHAYWFTRDGAIRRVSLAGGPVETIATGEQNVSSIAVDDTSVYWTKPGPCPALNCSAATDGSVMRAPLAGGSPPVTLAAQQVQPTSVTVDASNVVWALGTDPGGVRRLSKSGGAVQNVATNRPRPSSLIIRGGTLYFIDQAGVQSVPVLGGAVTTLAPGVFSAKLAVTSSRIITVQPTSAINGTVVHLPLTGGAPQPLTAFTQLSALVADDTEVYVLHKEGATSSGQMLVVRVALNGNAVVPLASGLVDASALVVDATSVYWMTNGGSIQVTPK